MPDIIFRWPEEEIQHAEPQYSYTQNKSDEYLDKFPTGLRGMKSPFNQNQPF